MLIIVSLGCGTLHAGDLLAKDSVSAAETSFNNYVDYMYHCIGDTSLTKDALRDGLIGYYNLKSQGKLKDTTKLTIVDFTQSGNNERLYVIDITNQSLIWKSLVAHGQKTGALYAKHFSNRSNSHQSSIGFYVTGQRWHDGRLGDCLQLYGKEYSNSKALTRGIIIHAADYATCEFINKYGTLGRSYGCPAVPFDGYNAFLDIIDNGTCYFIYYPSSGYKVQSKLINADAYLTEFAHDQNLYL